MLDSINNTHLWHFIGYHLIKASFTCKDKRDLQQFSIQSSDYAYEEKEKIFSYTLTLDCTGKGTKGSLSFRCDYRTEEPIPINEEDDAFQIMLSNMVALVFPFLRQTLMALTNDGYMPIFLPTIDVASLNPVEGSRFTKKKAHGDNA